MCFSIVLSLLSIWHINGKIFNCTGYGYCTDDILHCIEGEDCQLLCDETNCQGTTINCPSTNNTCDILCMDISYRSCERMTINGNISNGGALIVRGYDFQHILNQVTISCPVNGVCSIECIAPNACDHATIYASEGSIVNIIANGTHSLQFSNIYSSDNNVIDIICQGYLSCADINIDSRNTSLTDVTVTTIPSNIEINQFARGNIYCSQNGKCHLNCYGNSSCIYSNIHCANNFEEKHIFCNVKAVGHYAVDGMDIYAAESFYDFQLNVTGIIASNPIVHCTVNYSSICSIQSISNYPFWECIDKSSICQHLWFPTQAPTNMTMEPTIAEPTTSPTTTSPTNDPTKIPTNMPTNVPTILPTNIPTIFPSKLPTDAPSNVIITEIETTYILNESKKHNGENGSIGIIMAVLIPIVFCIILSIIMFVYFCNKKINMKQREERVQSTSNTNTVNKGDKVLQESDNDEDERSRNGIAKDGLITGYDDNEYNENKNNKMGEISMIERNKDNKNEGKDDNNAQETDGILNDEFVVKNDDDINETGTNT